MKATGIVRRMDDLGRVVIPKEIRRTMKIGEGTPLEIFIDRAAGPQTRAPALWAAQSGRLSAATACT